MKQSWLLLLLPLAVLLAVFGLFFVLFPGQFNAGDMLLSPVALFALASGAGSYAIVRGFRLGWNPAASISAMISLVVFLIAGIGVALELQGMRAPGIITSVITVAGFAVLLVVNDMDDIAFGKRKAAVDFDKAGPVEWADSLEAIGRRCSRPELKTRVLRLGGETRFLTVGSTPANSMVNQGIGRAIEELSEAVRLGDESSALSMLSGIRSLFAQRENQLKP
jgi:hypothetical protein